MKIYHLRVIKVLHLAFCYTSFFEYLRAGNYQYPPAPERSIRAYERTSFPIRTVQNYPELIVIRPNSSTHAILWGISSTLHTIIAPSTYISMLPSPVVCFFFPFFSFSFSLSFSFYCRGHAICVHAYQLMCIYSALATVSPYAKYIANLSIYPSIHLSIDASKET